jgi:hypothetical protein
MWKSLALRLTFMAILVIYVIYATLFIYNTSTVVEKNSYIPETKRYFVLFDDVMISMRYARNLVDGHGLVYNPGGERVEGFTNPLWVGYMALVHLIEDDEAVTALYIQISCLIFLAINACLIFGLTRYITGSDMAALGAMSFTAFFLPLNTWGLMGNEVALLTPMVTGAVWGTLRSLDRGRLVGWPLVIMALAIWVRMDMAVLYGCLGGFLYLVDRPNRRRYLGLVPALLVGVLAPLFLARYAYYDEWLPNTYYLKMTGVSLFTRLDRGIGVTFDYFLKMTPLVFLILLVRPDRQISLIAGLYLAQISYSVWVGGDSWESFGANRFITLVTPLFFVLLWATLHLVYNWLVEHLAALPNYQRGQKMVVSIGLVFFVGFLFINFNANPDRNALKTWVLKEKPLNANLSNQRVMQAKLLEALTRPGTTITVTEAGVVPYFAPGRVFIDILGVNDAVVARTAFRIKDFGAFNPGHTKWNYAYSVRELQPDVVFEWWVEDVTPYLDDQYTTIWFPPGGRNIYVRADSPNIYWERIRGE